MLVMTGACSCINSQEKSKMTESQKAQSDLIVKLTSQIILFLFIGFNQE